MPGRLRSTTPAIRSSGKRRTRRQSRGGISCHQPSKLAPPFILREWYCDSRNVGPEDKLQRVLTEETRTVFNQPVINERRQYQHNGAEDKE
jgi:hypothetical protein